MNTNAATSPMPYGEALAGRVAAVLESGHALSYAHREYGGMGLVFQGGRYVYAEVWDGRMPDANGLSEPNKKNELSFDGRKSFVAWLGAQTDAALSRQEAEDSFYRGNQTITHDRLLEFASKHEGLPQISLPRWTRFWQEAGCQGNGENWFRAVCRGYAEEHRHYHNLEHLNECLAELDQVLDLAVQSSVLQAALWFHDVVYDPQDGADNEGLSADWACEALAEGGALPSVVGDVRALILLTKKHVLDNTPDAALMCDIDLAILGRDEVRFQAYEQAIRREYAWVPAEDYLRGRSRVLESFLERPQIYATPFFQEQYEASAKRNLQASLACLQSGLIS